MTTDEPQDTTPQTQPQLRGDTLTLKEFQSAIHRISEWAQHGCKSGDCRIEKTTGMHMNAVCCCTPERFASKLRYIADQLKRHGKLPWPATDDDDLDEPLGKACSLDNPECESCQ